MRSRSASDARTAASSSRSRSRGGAGEPPGEQQMQRRGQRRPARQRAHGDRAEPASTLLALLLDLVGRVVGLEQQRLALGRPDPGVDLQQAAAELALVAVLGAVRSDISASVPPSLDDLELVVAERVAAADQLGPSQ